MDSRTAALRDRLRWRLIAAAATPADPAGEVDAGVLATYLGGLVADGADALAVLAHTGRGPYLSEHVRDLVVRTAVDTGVPVVVGVGGRPGERPDSVVRAAGHAAELGAHGLLVFPPDVGAVERHDAVWRAAGVPLLAFDLYTRPYPPPVLAELLDHPGVAALKVARLHDAIACQAALVGLAAAAVPVTAGVLRAFADKEYAEFVVASARLDRLASVVFDEPVEGYVQRMLWVAAAEGRIPPAHAHDPHRPDLSDVEQDQVRAVLDARMTRWASPTCGSHSTSTCSSGVPARGGPPGDPATGRAALLLAAAGRAGNGAQPVIRRTGEPQTVQPGGRAAEDHRPLGWVEVAELRGGRVASQFVVAVPTCVGKVSAP